MRTRADVVAAALSCIDIPFRHQGRTREGLDCVGLILLIARELELADMVEVPPYRRIPGKIGTFTIEEMCAHYMRSLDSRYASAGDVGLFQFHGRPHHLAIFANYGTADLSIIHAYEKEGKVCQMRFDESWRARLTAAYALPRVC